MKHKMNPILDAQLNRRRGFRGHKRNLSDPRFSTSLTDEYYTEDEVSQSDERIQGQLSSCRESWSSLPLFQILH